MWKKYIKNVYGSATLGIAVKEMGENINHDSNTNIKHIKHLTLLLSGWRFQPNRKTAYQL